MKRVGYLYQDVYDLENIEIAHKNARKGKRHYREVKKVDAEPEKYISKIHTMLKEKTFDNSQYSTMTRKTHSGKVRQIHKLPYFPDRIIQHAIMQVVEPIWYKTLIRDTYSAIKGRGIHDGVQRIKKALRNKKETLYCLKMDIRKYYPSINNEVLKNTIRKKIKDPDLLWLLDEIIDSAQGLPIGNYLSQYLGNLYLNSYDHWMKEKQRCKYYFRYCDDIVILHSSKQHLHNFRKLTQEYIKKLKLNLKDNWQIFPIDARGLDFLGYRFFHGYTLLRKSIAKRFKNTIKHIRENWRSMKPITVISSVMSYLGWFKYANCRNLINKYIDDTIYWIVKNKSREMQITNPLRGAI